MSKLKKTCIARNHNYEYNCKGKNTDCQIVWVKS